MTLTYKVKNGLYLNITNQCSNACDFCVRTLRDRVGNEGSLWLEHEPDAREMIDALEKRDLSAFDEVVFCGYGEPFCRLELLLEVAGWIKKRSDIQIRVNTNGQSDLINGKRTAPLLKGLIDLLSISLNAPTDKEYQEICHSEFGENAFDALIDFAKDAAEYVPTVVFSVVDVIGEQKVAQCRLIAEKVGIPLRVRQMIEE